MTDDLRAAMAALGREERDAAPDLPIDALTARAHRSRALHAATYSAIGVGAAAVLTLGAITADGLIPDRDPAPVPPATDEPRETAEPGVTPTSTPTATPTATPTEAAWEPSWDLCGMPTEDLYARETAWDWESESGWWIESMWPFDTTVPVDGLFPLALSVNGPDAADVTMEAQVTEVVAIETDYEAGTSHVVGVAAVPTGEVVRGQVADTDGDLLSLGSIETRLVSCDASPLTGGDGALDTSLMGTGYDVLAVAELRPDGGATVTTVAYVGHVGDVPNMPELPESEGPADTWRHWTLTVGMPLRLEPPETLNSANRRSDTQGPWCGTAASTTSLRNDSVPSMTLAGTGFRDGEELIVQMTLTNTGESPLLRGSLEYPYMAVSRDGTIIGSAYGFLSSFALPAPLQPGESVQLEISLGQSTCAVTGGEPWPAGTYELFAEAYLVVGKDVRPDIAGYGVRTTFTLD
jgi:hypothetical protein